MHNLKLERYLFIPYIYKKKKITPNAICFSEGFKRNSPAVYKAVFNIPRREGKSLFISGTPWKLDEITYRAGSLSGLLHISPPPHPPSGYRITLRSTKLPEVEQISHGGGFARGCDIILSHNLSTFVWR